MRWWLALATWMIVGSVTQAQRATSDEPVVVLRLYNGLNAIDLLGDGHRGQVVVNRRESHDTHGYSTAMFQLLALTDPADTTSAIAWQLIPFLGPDHPADGSELFRTTEGADCVLSDLRVFRRGRGRPVEVVLAHRAFGSSYADTAAVRFEFYVLRRNDEGTPGAPLTESHRRGAHECAHSPVIPRGAHDAQRSVSIRWRTDMQATSLDDLYSQKLQLLLDAEHQGLDAIPHLAQVVHDPTLRDALQQHRKESEAHVQRLLQLIDGNRHGSHNQECTSMRALIQEAQRTLANIQDQDTLDAFVIGAQQAIEHHEIAAYGTARSWAQELGRDDDARTLQQTLDEEENADEQLTTIAERRVNEQASKGADREVGISRGRETDRSRREESDRGAGRLTDVEAQRGADMR